MIIASLTNSYFSFDQMLTGKKLSSSQKNILDSIEQTDPEKAESLKKKIDDANEVITQLRSCKSNMSKSAKEAAAEKVRRIKEQIKMLMMMGGDPKMIAKQVAKLSKELAAAARGYSSGAVGATSSPDISTEASTSPDANMSTTAQNDSVASGATASLVTSTMTVSSESTTYEEKGENSECPASDITLTNQTGVVQDKNTQEDKEEALRQKLITDIQNNAAEIASKTSAADADREFAQEVRTLAALLKLLAKQQKQRLHQAGDHSADLEIAQINQALAEAEKSVSNVCAPAINVTV